MTRTTTLWSLLLLSAALALGSCTKDATEQATGPEPEAKAASKLVFSSENAVRGELLVCFGEEAVAGIESSVMQVTRSGGVATRSGIADFDAVLGSIGVKALQRLFPVDERNEERTRAAGLHRWYVVEFDDDADLDKAALDMARIAEVSKVEFNQQLMHVHEGRVIPLAETGAAPQTRAAVGFNDPHLGKQWHYINTGDKSIYSKIKAGADVNCDEAWKLCTGDPRVIVAVVDNCVQWDHPDLAANMWTNTAELNGSEGRDDDSNGYADDIHGFNFVDNTTLTISTKGDAPDHGTHVAGTVAAVNNNGTGVAGIAGGSGKNDGVKIMSCQIYHDKDGGDVAMAAKAIKYAADNGAAIIQCSYGYPAGSVTSDAAYSSGASAEKQAIDYFIAKQNCAAVSGGLAIFAAGNDMTGMSSYPGAYRDYISVTAMSCDYTPAYYTNYGPGCNIAAPGGDAYQSYLENIKNINQYCTGTKQELTDKGSRAMRDLSQYKKGMGTGYIDAYQVLMNVRGITCIPIPVGSQYTLNLQPYLGGGNLDLKITEISISAEDMNRLGISANPTIFANQIILKCTKPGSAVVRIKLLAGNGNNSGMNGMPITKEFAFIAREVHSQNGGWL